MPEYIVLPPGSAKLSYRGRIESFARAVILQCTDVFQGRVRCVRHRSGDV